MPLPQPSHLSDLLSPPSAADLQAAAVIGAAFVILIGAAELWRLVKHPPIEWTRKLVHLGGGMISLAFPFVIVSHWVVLGLGVALTILFVFSKRRGWLKSIHAVSRPSAGTSLYPVVIYLLFVLCGGVAWRFVTSVLVLAVSDTAAALVGKRFGRHQFLIEQESKSIEGSLAFFAVTFVVVFVPLLLWNPLGDLPQATTQYLLAAILIGLLVTCVELISLYGFDNLWIPLGTLLVLTKTMHTDRNDLIIQNVSFISILFVLIAGSLVSHTFNVGGALVICLASYGCWAMGSFDWALPVFIGFGVYLLVAQFVRPPWQLRVRPVLYNLIVPFVVLGIANILLTTGHVKGYRFLFVPFLAAVSVALAQGCGNMIGWKYKTHCWKRLLRQTFVALAAAFALNLPAIFRGTLGWPALGVLALVVVIVSLVSHCLMKPLPPGDAPPRWLSLRAAFTAVAGAIVFGLQAVGISPPGNPW